MNSEINVRKSEGLIVMRGKKEYNRLIYHSIYPFQTVIFVVKKFLSGFDGHSTSPCKGKEEAQQNQINETKVTVQETVRKGLGKGKFNWKNWNCIFNNTSCVLLTFFKLLKQSEMALKCQFSIYLEKSSFSPFLTCCS